MYNHRSSQSLKPETTCGSLLSELQKIWDEVGEEDNERDKMLLELEQECLDAYRRKVDQASRCRAQLRQAVVDAEAQLADICAALEDRPVFVKKTPGSLKNELQTLMPQLEDMKKKKNERKNQFAEVLTQINSVSRELSRSTEVNLNVIAIDENDLSLKRLNDLQNQLLALQKEKSERLKQVLDQLNVLKSLCTVLGMDFTSMIRDIHPTLDESGDMKSTSADTIEKLSVMISRLKGVKLQRMQRLQDLAMTMVELWSLMDTPVEEQQMFHNVTRSIAASDHEITEPNTLSLEFINNAEAEVTRLQEMKMSKMKEVLLKKKLVLEEICQGSHMVVEGQFATDLSEEAIESGAISPSFLLEQLEFHISKAKEEAFSRKEILEKVQKWLAACEEECWLEEYNRDDNRYNAGRGTHLMLKRAEKARILVNKIPAMVEGLKSKIKAWETESGVKFLYDGVDLQSMLDQYCDLKHLKEQERQRQRDQKKLQGQIVAEQEAIYGSKPSPSKSGHKNFRPSIGGSANKRFSLGGAVLQNMVGEKTSISSRSLMKNNSTLKPQSSRSLHQGSVMAVSSGKKNISGGPVKQQSSNAHNIKNTESSSMRKPLSPLSSLSSNIASLNFQDQTVKSGEFMDRSTGYKSLATTPAKNLSSLDENRTPPTKNVSSLDEKRTPKTMPIPMPATPPTVSRLMQTATTPFTPGVRGVHDVEYSYEERRAGFVLPKCLPQLV